MFFRKKKPVIKPDVDGLSYEADIARRSYWSERLAWIIAFAGLGLAGLGLGAVWVMLPLKQTIPYYVYVDKETGIQQAVVVDNPTEITTNEAVIRYWLAKYVSTRERYLYRLLQDDFEFVMSTSASAVATEYARQYEDGPNKKDAVLKDGVEERINILNTQVTPGAIGRGTVRYQKITWRVGMREPDSVRTYVADVAFDWVSVRDWNTRDLLKNPMGFVVVGYRSTQELEAR
jgi:type IV secretion system protein VirB8